MKTKERGLLGCARFSRPIVSSYIRKIDRHTRWKKVTLLIDKTQKNKAKCSTEKEIEGAKGYFKNGSKRKCSTWLKKRRRQKDSQRRRQGGREGGKLEPSKLKSIFRKMFICRSVKLTRGVYLPALPSLSLCYHLLRSLSLSLCSGSAFCTDRTILHCKVPCEHASPKCCCCAALYCNAAQ